MSFCSTCTERHLGDASIYPYQPLRLMTGLFNRFVVYQGPGIGRIAPRSMGSDWPEVQLDAEFAAVGTKSVSRCGFASRLEDRSKALSSAVLEFSRYRDC